MASHLKSSHVSGFLHSALRFEHSHFVISRCGSFISVVFTYQNKWSVRVGYWVVSGLGLLPENTAMDILVWRLWPMLTFLWRIYRSVRLWGHKVHTLYSTQLDNSKLYFKVFIQQTLLWAVNKNFSCSVSSPTLAILRLFHGCKSDGCVVVFHPMLTCFFPVSNEVEHLFTCLFAVRIFPL